MSQIYLAVNSILLISLYWQVFCFKRYLLKGSCILYIIFKQSTIALTCRKSIGSIAQNRYRSKSFWSRFNTVFFFFANYVRAECARAYLRLLVSFRRKANKYFIWFRTDKKCFYLCKIKIYLLLAVVSLRKDFTVSAII